MNEILGTIISSVIGGLIVGAINLVFFHRQKVLEKKVERLERERLDKLEQKIDEHINSDPSKACMVQFEYLTATISEMSGKLDKLLSSDAVQTTDIKNIKETISEMKYNARSKK